MLIEHDLNMEIDRLMQTSAAQKQKIVELECLLTSAAGDIPLNTIFVSTLLLLPFDRLIMIITTIYPEAKDRHRGFNRSV